MVNGETIIGVDFAGPQRAASQRKKIIGIAATRTGSGAYRITPDGFNARLIQIGQPPGWTARELVDVLLGANPPRIVAFDFPFSIPHPLLNDSGFGSIVGHDGPFITWDEFNRFVAKNLSLQPPIDFSPFKRWQNKTYWRKRATDVLAGAQPALKHQFQVLFNMTLLGNALLAPLALSGRYRIVPFTDTGPNNEAIEVYPGVTMRTLGFREYKRDPHDALRILLAYCADRGIRIDLDPAVRNFCETYNSASGGASDPDGSDALIALATAILYEEGHCRELIHPEDQHLRAVEGAIWGPRGRSESPGRPNPRVVATDKIHAPPQSSAEPPTSAVLDARE